MDGDFPGAAYMRQGVDGAVVRETTAVGLDALADAAALREEAAQVGPLPASPSSPVRTTKHPRHRPGCTCIVCIQPPSGKGPKHKPNCICNVCVTVRRRFKTQMMRRKKREIDTHVRKRKAFQFAKDGVDGEQSRIATLKSSLGMLEDSSFGRVGAELQDPAAPIPLGTSSSGTKSRRFGGKDDIFGIDRKGEMASVAGDHSHKVPSVRLELGSEKSVAASTRAINVGDEESSWRTRPSQIDLNMQPDGKPDDIQENVEVDEEHGGAPRSWQTGGNYYVTQAAVNTMQPPPLMVDGSSSGAKIVFEQLEHPSSSRSHNRSAAEARVSKFHTGDTGSRGSAKDVESELVAQQPGQFAVSTFPDNQSMVAES